MGEKVIKNAKILKKYAKSLDIFDGGILMLSNNLEEIYEKI